MQRINYLIQKMLPTLIKNCYVEMLILCSQLYFNTTPSTFSSYTVQEYMKFHAECASIQLLVYCK